MGEAILGRASGSIISGSGSSSGLKTEIFTDDFCWVAPKAKNQTFLVRIFGGGGSGYISGGGGGYMNNGEFQINEGESVLIGIGRGGCGIHKRYSYVNTSVAYATNSHFIATILSYSPNSGGTTSFGTYLSAAGGEGSYLEYNSVTYNYTNNSKGGDGGSGGGGGNCLNNKYSHQGGIGYQFGGGGGCAISGLGGTWGGDGGSSSFSNIPDGTNTIGIEPDNLAGAGLSGGKYGGGGGYGGNGGNGYSTGTGGGGGYGAKGGNGINNISINTNNVGACGGGGGYSKLGKGGDGVYVVMSNDLSVSFNDSYEGEHGEYITFAAGGGGGGYGPGGSANIKPLYGGGGSIGYDYGRGADGICIIQYYI